MIILDHPSNRWELVINRELIATFAFDDYAEAKKALKDARKVLEFPKSLLPR